MSLNFLGDVGGSDVQFIANHTNHANTHADEVLKHIKASSDELSFENLSSFYYELHTDKNFFSKVLMGYRPLYLKSVTNIRLYLLLLVYCIKFNQPFIKAFDLLVSRAPAVILENVTFLGGQGGFYAKIDGKGYSLYDFSLQPNVVPRIVSMCHALLEPKNIWKQMLVYAKACDQNGDVNPPYEDNILKQILSVSFKNYSIKEIVDGIDFELFHQLEESQREMLKMVFVDCKGAHNVQEAIVQILDMVSHEKTITVFLAMSELFYKNLDAVLELDGSVKRSLIEYMNANTGKLNYVSKTVLKILEKDAQK